MLFCLRQRNETASNDGNFSELVKICNQGKEYAEVLRKSLTELRDHPALGWLQNARNALVEYRNEYLNAHQAAYEAHHSELEKIRASWSKEQEEKS
jgi:hypothetical protein